MAQTPPTTSTRKRRARSLASRRAGYAVSIVVNLVVAFIVNNLLAWDLLGFLTDDFEQVLPFINVSIGVSIVSSAVCLWRDPPWVRAAGQVAEGIASVVAIVRTYQVFPFEFSGSFPWAGILRVLLVLAAVGTVIGVVAEVVQLAREGGPTGDDPGDAGRQPAGTAGRC